jgi:solute carrier family 25 2-oxodicarboxylate transporter 21
LRQKERDRLICLDKNNRGVRKALPESETHSGVLLKNFIAGTIGGTVGTILNTPFDVAKTRIQSQTTLPLKYNWTIPAVARIYREEGFKALYKGFVPKVLRLGPGGGILLVVFDFVSGFIRQNLL